MEFINNTAIIGLIGVIIGYSFSFLSSFKDRKQRKELQQLEISHKKEIFEIEKTQRQELFNLERKDKFRLVAIEKRLEAHQLALKHWYDLRDVIHETDYDKRMIVINSAYKFWMTHCLYLEKQTQDKFYIAIVIVDRYKMNMELLHSSIEDYEKKRISVTINDNWDKFHEVHPLIFSEVELEPIKFEVKGNALNEKVE